MFAPDGNVDVVNPATTSCQRWTLRVVCLATALLMVNVAGPQVALQDIADALDASFTDLQWVLSGYALALAVFLLTAGSLADRFGRRRVFLIGLVVFGASSLLCAAAPGPVWLIVARVIQGVGAATVFPSSLAILAEEFHGPARRSAIGIWGATIGLAFAIGPLVAGALVDTLGWRAIFAFNVVLAVPAVFLTVRFLHESRDPGARPVDLPGVASLSLGLFLIVFAVLRGNALGWDSPVILGCLAAGAVVLAVFVAIERRVPLPMIDMSLFRNRTFTGASIVVALLAGSSFAALVYLTLFMLEVQGRDPVETGLVLAPLAVVAFVVSAGAGRINERVPLRGALVGGMLVTALGVLLLRGLEHDGSWTEPLLGLVVLGAGVGLVNPLATFAHLGVLPPSHGGLASALNNTARQLGLAVGIAVLGALLEGSVSDAGARPGTPAYGDAFANALDDLWLITLGVSLVAALAAATLVNQHDLWTPPAEPAPPAEPEPASAGTR
jgi:EmrB/QacA subfamily drug resistance transporter